MFLYKMDIAIDYRTEIADHIKEFARKLNIFDWSYYHMPLCEVGIYCSIGHTLIKIFDDEINISCAAYKCNFNFNLYKWATHKNGEIVYDDYFTNYTDIEEIKSIINIFEPNTYNDSKAAIKQ